jgi:hypothetical protein
MIWSDGTVYKGLWHNDQRVKGKLKMKNGAIYKGEFKNDLFHGKGKLSIKHYEIEFFGIFENGIRPDHGTIRYLGTYTEKDRDS